MPSTKQRLISRWILRYGSTHVGPRILLALTSAAAYHYAERGTETTADPHGTVGLWLLGLQARAAAMLGDAETVRVANEQAADVGAARGLKSCAQAGSSAVSRCAWGRKLVNHP